jgi:hypothetical protein
LDYTPLIPPTAHNQQLNVAQLGMPLTAHLHEEGIQVDMDDASGHLHLNDCSDPPM